MRRLSMIGLLAFVHCSAHQTAAPSAGSATAAATDPCIVGPRVLTSSDVDSRNPVVASRRDELGVVWEEDGDEARELHMQVFDAHGAPLAKPIVIAQRAGNPMLTATDDGYTIFWPEDRADTTAVVMQRVDTRGRPIAPRAEVFTSPTARLLAVTPTSDGFVLVWWQWAKTPHRQVATWLDANGGHVSDVELTLTPCNDPMADARVDANGRVRVTWEELVDGEQRVVVGLLERNRIVRHGSQYVGRDPALLSDGVVMTSLSSAAVLFAPLDASSAAPLAAGRMVDGSVLGDDSVLCRAQQGDSGEGDKDELFCSREKRGELLRERKLARSRNALGSAQVADTSFGYVVAVGGKHPEDPETDAVYLTVVQCND